MPIGDETGYLTTSVLRVTIALPEQLLAAALIKDAIACARAGSHRDVRWLADAPVFWFELVTPTGLDAELVRQRAYTHARDGYDAAVAARIASYRTNTSTASSEGAEP